MTYCVFMGAETAGMFLGKADCVDLTGVVVRALGCVAVCAAATSAVERRNRESERRARGMGAPKGICKRLKAFSEINASDQNHARSPLPAGRVNLRPLLPDSRFPKML